MSDNDEDDRTMYVVPPTAATRDMPVKPVPAADVDERPADDRTVMMKPSQRARAAAAALSEERRERVPDSTVTQRPTTTRVDFDVMSGGPETAAPERAPATRRSWLIAAAIAALVALAVVGYFVF